MHTSANPYNLEGLTYAYSYALNYSSPERIFQTMAHIDPHNLRGSPSVIVFAGHGYQGGLYMLPQYGIALGTAPGTMILHFSAQKDDNIGYHATSSTVFTEYATPSKHHTNPH